MLKKTVLVIIIFTMFLAYGSTTAISSVNTVLTSHEPIFVSTDDDFESLGFTGSGTKSDPYIIENLSIEAPNDTGIRIHYTTKYFVIRNCQIVGSDYGIYVSLVAEGTAVIENNRVEGCSEGIHVISSNSTMIKENQCHNCSYGIWVSQCGSIEVISNTITKIEKYMIEVRYTENAQITNNTLGIPFTAGSYGNLRLGYSSECIITYNTFEESVLLDSFSEDNKIHHNNFQSTARDDGKYNEWYDSEKEEGNWWKDYTGHGVVDIYGSAGAQDLYPLKEQATYIESASVAWIFLISIPLLAMIRSKRKNNE